MIRTQPKAMAGVRRNPSPSGWRSSGAFAERRDCYMARIPYVERENASPEIKEFYDTFAKQFNWREVPNVMKALANSPKLAPRAFPLGDYVMHESPRGPRLRELPVLTLMDRARCTDRCT